MRTDPFTEPFAPQLQRSCSSSSLNDHELPYFSHYDFKESSSSSSGPQFLFSPEEETLTSTWGDGGVKNFSYYFDESEEMEVDEDFSDLLNDDSDLEEACDSDSCFSDDEDEQMPLDCYYEPPFWYTNEDEEHLSCIFSCYNEQHTSPEEFKRSVQPFVGRISRRNASSDPSLFQTFDMVTINNCQRMRAHRPMPTIREGYFLTTWDDDGLPIRSLLLNENQVQFWLHKLQNEPISYIHCRPHWHHQGEVAETQFSYCSSPEPEEVTYCDVPGRGEFEPFVAPNHHYDDLDDIDIIPGGPTEALFK